MKKVLLIAAICSCAFGSALSTLASFMQPGTWAELATSNISQTLSNLSGASGTMIVYTDDLSWDPASEQIFKIGADHLASQGPQFASYTASTNTWQRLSRPSWLSSLTFFHGYDHGAMDEAKGVFYHRPYSQNVVHRYNVATQAWSQVPSMPWSDYANCCDALEYFPELRGLVWVSGNGCVYLFRDSTSQWVKLTTLAAGSTWQQAEYNPVHKVMVFTIGGRFYKLASNGQATQLNNPPISLYDGSGWNGTLTVDPVSGLYLVLTPTNRQFYTYDVLTDTWQAQNSPTKPSMSQGVAATPIAKYGVTFFVNCGSTTCRAYLYKGTAAATERSRSWSAGNAPAVSPNPFRSTIEIRADPACEALSVYSVGGRLIKDFDETSVTWDASGLPAGVYLVKAMVGGKSLISKIILQK